MPNTAIGGGLSAAGNPYSSGLDYRSRAVLPFGPAYFRRPHAETINGMLTIDVGLVR